MTARLRTLPLGVLLLAACASYNERTGRALSAFEAGRFGAADRQFEKALEGKAPFLAGAERGMVALSAGRWDRAVEQLGAAAGVVQDIEREALISPENAGELLTSWVVNETFTEYHGEGYERAMLHACLGLAYLARGQVDDLLVEVRLTDKLLTGDEKLFDADYRAGGLAHALSAIAYEMRGDLDDAYIDYTRMAEKDIGGELVGRSLVRLARALGRTDALAHWVRRYGDEPPPPDDTARVVLIAGVGLGPFKEEARLDIPTPDGFLSWAVPVFRERPQAIKSLELRAANLDASVRSVVVEDVSRIAKRNLEDRIAWLAAKSTVRTFLKRELRKNLEDRHGVVGALAGDLITIFSERADLRAWTTLPDSWQVARMFVPPGPVDLALAAPGAQPVQLGAYQLDPGETLFVLARSIDRRLFAHAIGGRPIELSPNELLDALEEGPSAAQ